jgi:Tol biopolymer transport system component
VAVATVTVHPDTVPLVVGLRVHLYAEVLSADRVVLLDRVVNWESSDTAIATVTETGAVTARRPGTVTVTAVCEGRRGIGIIAVTILPGVYGLAFVRYDWTLQFEIIEPGGAGITLLPSGLGTASPAWTLDGSRFAYVRDVSHGDIYTANRDGSDSRAVIVSPWFDGDPTWSPDASRLAFTRFEGGPALPRLFVANADGSDERWLTEFGYGANPAWSPDGTTIAFELGGIATASADGSGYKQLLDYGSAPEWSPDGTRIAFVTSVGVLVMSADGSGVIQLTPATFHAQSGVSWSPDGSTIAVSGFDETCVAPYPCIPKIFLIDPDSGHMTPLTVGESPVWRP